MKGVHMADRVVITLIVVGAGLMLMFVPRDVARQMSPDVTLVAEQIRQQGTTLPTPATAVPARAIRFVCNQQTLPNDIASCMNRAVRLYFEGDWTGADLCTADGETCHALGTLLSRKGKP